MTKRPNVMHVMPGVLGVMLGRLFDEVMEHLMLHVGSDARAEGGSRGSVDK